jgi:ubiquinone/menaquinone biosynthesis C-methylase UbiE
MCCFKVLVLTVLMVSLLVLLTWMVLQKTHSFDLVSAAPHVVACNMAHVPLEAGSVDVAVFSLALMGTDYGAFLREAARVLRHRGWLWIAEVGGVWWWW